MTRQIRIFILTSVTCLIAFTMIIAFGATSQAVGAFFNPHGDYEINNEGCSICHNTHSSPGSNLLTANQQKGVCYTCHDGSKSIYNTREEFGEVTIGSSVYASRHPVPEGSQLCTSCHDPHLKPLVTPSLLSAGMDNIPSGNEVCGVCHGSATTLPSGDILARYVYTAHDTKMPNPPSGNGIKCVNCHETHGSPYKPLLKRTIQGVDGVTRTVYGNDSTFCFGCHEQSLDKYSGKTIYSKTRHSTEAVWPGANKISGICQNCHEPHGTGFTAYKRAEGNDLCYTCHPNPVSTAPEVKVAWAGYGGPTAQDPVELYMWNYSGSSWNSLASAQVSTAGWVYGSRTDYHNYINNFNEVYLMVKTKHDYLNTDSIRVEVYYPAIVKTDTFGFNIKSEAWHSTNQITPSAPGTVAESGYKVAITNQDGIYWRSSLPVHTATYDYQMFRMKLADYPLVNSSWKGKDAYLSSGHGNLSSRYFISRKMIKIV